VVEIPLGAVPGTSRRECPACRRFLGFVPTDPARSSAWARSCRIKTGRHAGRTLGELAETRMGLELLCWLSENASQDLRRAARLVLDDRAEAH
jgi:hypothetical protein